MHIGDIFYEKYNGNYFFGKVLFDTDMGKGDVTPPLSGLLDSFIMTDLLLIRLYSNISDSPQLSSPTEFKTFWVKRKYYTKRGYTGEEWGVIGNEPIDIQLLSFPDGLLAKGKMYLAVGECLIRTPLDRQAYFDIRKPVAYYRDFIQPVLHLLEDSDKLNLIKPENQLPSGVSILNRDFRWSPHRKMVYESLGLPEDIPYYELAKSQGLDIRRFYKNT